MPIQFDKFEQSKVDNLKNHLVSMASKGKAKPYAIFVDSLKAVPKTDDPAEFDGYEDYMTPETAQLKIVIFNSDASPRNDQYVFLFKAQSREEAVDIGLNGTPVKTFSFNDISEWRKKNEKKSAEQIQIQALKKEIVELNEIIDEKDEQIEKLSDVIIKARENGNKLGGIHIGDILSVAVEGLVKRNTHILAKVPGLDGLAGLLEKENNTPAIAAPETEVTIKKKDHAESEPAVSEEEKDFIKFFRELRRHFTEDEMGLVIDILDALSQDKQQLPIVLDLLKSEESGEGSEEEDEVE